MLTSFKAILNLCYKSFLIPSDIKNVFVIKPGLKDALSTVIFKTLKIIFKLFIFDVYSLSEFMCDLDLALNEIKWQINSRK